MAVTSCGRGAPFVHKQQNVSTRVSQLKTLNIYNGYTSHLPVVTYACETWILKHKTKVI